MQRRYYPPPRPREETYIFLPWQHGKNNDATNRGFLALFGYDRVRSLGDGGWIGHVKNSARGVDSGLP